MKTTDHHTYRASLFALSLIYLIIGIVSLVEDAFRLGFLGLVISTPSQLHILERVEAGELRQ